MKLNFTALNKTSSKIGSIMVALSMAAIPVMVNAASPAGADSLNGFYITLGPNIQNTKVDKTTSLGDGAENFVQKWRQSDGTFAFVGGLQPTTNWPTITQYDSSESKTGVLPQLTLGYMHPLWGAWQKISLGVEAFYTPKAGSSNIASTTYGGGGLLAYNFVPHTQAYFKLSYVSMKTNLTGSQQFYSGVQPFFGPAGSNARIREGDPDYTDPTFKIDQQVHGFGVVLGARYLLPFKILGSSHLFAGGELSYTKYASKTIASPEYHNPVFFGSGGIDGSITNTKISAKQYGANLYVGYRF